MKKILEKLVLAGVLVGALTFGAGAVTKNKTITYVGEGIMSTSLAGGFATSRYLSDTKNKLYDEGDDYAQ